MLPLYWESSLWWELCWKSCLVNLQISPSLRVQAVWWQCFSWSKNHCRGSMLPWDSACQNANNCHKSVNVQIYWGDHSTCQVEWSGLPHLHTLCTDTNSPCFLPGVSSPLIELLTLSPPLILHLTLLRTSTSGPPPLHTLCADAESPWFLPVVSSPLLELQMSSPCLILRKISSWMAGLPTDTK